MADSAVAHHNDLVRQGDDALLVGDDDHGAVARGVDLLKGLRQPGEAPQVDARLRLVEDHQLGVPGQDRGDLDALDLAAGEADVYLPVQIVVGAETYLGEVLAALVLGELLCPVGQGQQVPHRQPLEAGGLLEAVADAKAGPLCDAKGRDVLSVPEDLAGGGRHQTHDDLGQGGLAAAVGAGEYHQAVVRNGKGDVVQNAQLPVSLPHGVADGLEFQHGLEPPQSVNFKNIFILPDVAGKDNISKRWVYRGEYPSFWK